MGRQLRTLDLFSGIGGFSLGLERTGGFKTVAFCEIEEFPRRVLAKHWPGVPIHRDVRELRGSDIGAVDVVCGGYPCQPFSLAGQRRGAEDDRHLWPEMRRLVDELRPSWVIGENVAGHIGMGLDAVLSNLAALGYACRAFVVPALAIGAPHRRNRVWIVAHADEFGGRAQSIGEPQCRYTSQPRHDGVPQPLADDQGDGRRAGRPGRSHSGDPRQPEQALQDVAYASDGIRRAHGRSVAGSEDPREREAPIRPVREGHGRAGDDGLTAGGWWEFEPDVGRVAHGVPARVDRLRGLGNAVVPQIPEIIGRAILQAEAA